MAGKKKLKPIDLVNNLEKVAQEIANDFAYELSFEILGQYNHVIDMFYADYPPAGRKLSYRRTYSTYEAAESFDDVSKGIKPIPGGFEVGVRISSDNIAGKRYYGGSNEEVFVNTFQRGIHGFPWFGMMSPSPKQLMDEWWASFKKGNRIQKIQDESVSRVFKKYGIDYKKV